MKQRPIFLDKDQQVFRGLVRMTIWLTIFGFGYIAGAAGV